MIRADLIVRCSDTADEARPARSLERQALPQKLEEIRQEVGRLKALAAVLERWHQDMIVLMAHSRGMNEKSEDLSRLSRELTMVSLNATIEGARMGSGAEAFVFVAKEVKTLAGRVMSLSAEVDQSVYKTDLVTSATFQDIQAGGKLMMAAISGLEAMVGRLSTEIG